MLTVELTKPISYGGVKRQAGDRLSVPSLFATQLLEAGLAKTICDGGCPLPEPVKEDEPEPKPRRTKKVDSEGAD